MKSTSKNVEKAINYAQRCVDGKEIVGKLIRLQSVRFFKDLESPNVFIDEVFFDKIITFVTKGLRLPTGKQVVLQPWQYWFLLQVFAVKYKDTNKNKYKRIFLLIGRKNGKSFIAAILGLIAIIFQDERDDAVPEVVCAANSKEQANIILQQMTQILRHADPNEGAFKRPKTNRATGQIECKKSMGVVKVVSSDSSKLDGLNLSSFIIDEYHEAIDDAMYSVLAESQGNRSNPQQVIISTAGFKVGDEYPCYALWQHSKRVLNEELDSNNDIIKDEALLPIIYQLDEDDDWKTSVESKTIKKAQPMLGVTVDKDWLSEQLVRAKNQPTHEFSVRTKLTNEFIDSSEDVWMRDELVTNRFSEMKIEDYKGAALWIGFDLSMTQDLSSVSFLVVPNPNDDSLNLKYRYFTRSYLPSDNLKTRNNSMFWQQMAEQGFVKITDGAIIDYNVIYDDIMDIINANSFDVRAIAYDPYNASTIVSKLMEAGFEDKLVKHGQTFIHMNKGVKEMERVVLDSSIDTEIESSKVLRWCFRNSIIVRDNRGNVKLDKESFLKKIDPVVACVMATGALLYDKENGNLNEGIRMW